MAKGKSESSAEAKEGETDKGKEKSETNEPQEEELVNRIWCPHSGNALELLVCLV
jgi:hypothetical protein